MLLKILIVAIITGTVGITVTVPYGSEGVDAVVSVITQTPVHTPTATPSTTLTVTPIPTSTWTPEPSPTPTSTPSPTQTSLPTPTPTPTPLAMGCTHTIALNVAMYVGSGLAPGAVLCVASGNRGPLVLSALVGSLNNPIIVRNVGDVVNIFATGSSKPLTVDNSRYIRVLGNGVSDQCGAAFADSDTQQKCGIRLLDGSTGILAGNKVSDIEIAYMEVAGSDNTSGITFGAGVKVHSNSSEIVSNVYIHHVYVHNTYSECVYIGLAGNVGTSPMYKPRVTHSLLVRCGWDGIAWKQAYGPNEIGHNIIRRVGHVDLQGQQEGISIVLSGEIWIHDNVVEDAFLECIKTLNPRSGIVIERNRIGKCGSYHVLDRSTSLNTMVINNTLILPGAGIDVRGTGTKTGNVTQ